MSKSCGELGVKEFEVVWGGEKYQPVSFNFFDVGEVRIKVVPNPDSSFEESYKQAMEIAMVAGKTQFDAKLKEHLDRLSEAAKATEAQRRANLSR
jgi:hypothetical protein